MTLRAWLLSIGKNSVWLAAQLGITHQAVYSWLQGRSAPQARHLAEIERLSEGKVTARTYLETP